MSEHAWNAVRLCLELLWVCAWLGGLGLVMVAILRVHYWMELRRMRERRRSNDMLSAMKRHERP